MRPHIRHFVSVCAESLELPEPIVEIGSKRHPSQEKLANLRTVFKGRSYIGCDMDSGPGVDRIENLEQLGFNDGEVGTFVLCDTLEHVRDLELAMSELKRCLNPTSGVLIATSVMLFPVHSFPNDYWRFTPEGFRELARNFPWVATYYSGDPNFPHSVALVACCREPDPEIFERLSTSLSQSTPVPHYTDAKSEKMFAALGSLLVEGALSSGLDISPSEGVMGVLSHDAWVLTPGSWIKVAIPSCSAAVRIELKANGQTVQVVDRRAWNILLEDEPDGLHETAFQFDPAPGAPVGVVQVEVLVISSTGVGERIARSRPGVILPHADLARGFTLHAVDQRWPDNKPLDYGAVEKAQMLVRDLRSRGEKVIVDLGCGFRKAGNIGIDATASNTDADLICLLGFDALPFADGVVDEIVCRDFLEHIPKAVYLESKKRLHYPVMQLMDEIWRVLRPGGVFRSWTPMYPHPEIFQDPTHLSAWTIKSMDYFCGIYPGAKRIYGIQACFEKIEVKEEGFYLFAELRKPIAAQ